MAEIVGTLMLVVIVVAAATAFSFFVASYEGQVLSQENQQHLRGLEAGRVTGVQVCTPSTCTGLYKHYLPAVVGSPNYVVNVSFVSADTNSMFLTDYLVDSTSVGGWIFNATGTTPSWMDGTDGAGCSTSNVTNLSCEQVGPFQHVNISLILPYVTTIVIPLSLQVFTSLADEFQYKFLAPVAIATTQYVTSSGGSIPIFDAAGSYQPAESDNASLVDFVWTAYPDGSPGTTVCVSDEYVSHTCVPEDSVEFEPANLVPNATTVESATISSQSISGTQASVAFEFEYSPPGIGQLTLGGAVYADPAYDNLATGGVSATEVNGLSPDTVNPGLNGPIDGTATFSVPPGYSPSTEEALPISDFEFTDSPQGTVSDVVISGNSISAGAETDTVSFSFYYYDAGGSGGILSLSTLSLTDSAYLPLADGEANIPGSASASPASLPSTATVAEHGQAVFDVPDGYTPSGSETITQLQVVDTTPYVVTLTVTNTDGLVGTATFLFTPV